MYCKYCGKQIPPDSLYCNYCGGVQSVRDTRTTGDEPVDSISAGDEYEEVIIPSPNENIWQPPPEPQHVQPPPPIQPQQPQQSTDAGISRRQKAIGFWSRHPIFSNLVAAVCAVTVLFVALFSPIVIPWYDMYGGAPPEDGFTAVRSEQTIFMIIESLPYYLGAEYDESKLAEQRDKAVTAAQEEYYEWAQEHPSASDAEKLQKRYDLIAEHLSDLNCFKYMAVTAKTTESDRTKAIICISLLFGIVVVILSIVMAVTSLTVIVKAIVGMCKRQANDKLFRYLGKMFAISTAGVTLTMCAPLLCVGGGMLAVALISAGAYLVCAVVKAAVGGERRIKDIIMGAVVALLATAVFIMLCVDPMTVGSIDKTTTINTPIGFGLYSRLMTVFGTDGSGDAWDKLPNNIGIGFAQYVAVACVAVPLVAKGLLRSLRRLCGTEYGKPRGNLVVAAVALSVAIILGLLSKPIYDFLSENYGDGHYYDILWKMRPHVWVCVALCVSTAIFDKTVFRNRA